jgi:hypothetical protein
MQDSYRWNPSLFNPTSGIMAGENTVSYKKIGRVLAKLFQYPSGATFGIITILGKTMSLYCGTIKTICFQCLKSGADRWVMISDE